MKSFNLLPQFLLSKKYNYNYNRNNYNGNNNKENCRSTCNGNNNNSNKATTTITITTTRKTVIEQQSKKLEKTESKPFVGGGGGQTIDMLTVTTYQQGTLSNQQFSANLMTSQLRLQASPCCASSPKIPWRSGTTMESQSTLHVTQTCK